MSSELAKISMLIKCGLYADMVCEVMDKITPDSAHRINIISPMLGPVVYRKHEHNIGVDINKLIHDKGCLWCFGTPHNKDCPYSTNTLARYAESVPCNGCGGCAQCRHYVSYDATVGRLMEKACNIF